MINTLKKTYNLMKRLLILFLSVFSLSVVAQQKKVAVYVTGNDPINDIVSSRLMDGIAKSGKYRAVERTAAFLNELSKEQNYQSTGAVDDNEISRLGKQFGKGRKIQCMCLVLLWVHIHFLL